MVEICALHHFEGVCGAQAVHTLVAQTLVHPGGADILVVDCCDTN